MEMVKLINAKGDIIERMKIQYEPNVKIWEQRGWKLYDEKAQPKKEPVKSEPVDNQTVVDESLSSEWQEEKPKSSKKKDK
tara:strand:- start:2631 stop:2870 length:240 start_codon:yes stop_codon:yes gene_type:complete